MIEVPIMALDTELAIPAPVRVGDAAADLPANESTVLAAGSRALVGTGFAVAIPLGACGLILPRSGLAIKHGITCLNSPGLIDPGYRGELKVILHNTSDEDFKISRGDRIAQLLIVGLDTVSFLQSESLPAGPDDRGAQGFGSSGTAK